MRIVEGDSKGLGLMQISQDTLKVARRRERRAQGEPETDGLLACGTCLRQMREGTERLLEISSSLVVGRLYHGLLPSLPAVRQGLGPQLAAQGMVCQAFDLLGHTVSGERFKNLHDAGVQLPPPLQQEAAVGHLI